MANRLLGRRIVHMLVLTAFVAVALFRPIRALVPAWDLLLAIGLLVAWMLGQRYEREMIAEAGLVDREKILAVERQSMSWGRSKK